MDDVDVAEKVADVVDDVEFPAVSTTATPSPEKTPSRIPSSSDHLDRDGAGDGGANRGGPARGGKRAGVQERGEGPGGTRGVVQSPEDEGEDLSQPLADSRARSSLASFSIKSLGFSYSILPTWEISKGNL